MRFDIVTLFTGSFHGPFAESIVARAVKSGIVQINLVDLRDFTEDRRRTVDDTPYGGGPGMLMKPEPLFKAVESLRTEGSLVVHTSPSGRRYDQKTAEELSRIEHVILLCGHYEGVDQRVLDSVVDMELSIGDYVLTNGNIPAMVIVDSVSRLLPGALGHPESAADESFTDGLLEYPQYTKPAEFRGMRVPDILLSGDHKKILEWRRAKAFETTMKRRPDLLAQTVRRTDALLDLRESNSEVANGQHY